MVILDKNRCFFGQKSFGVGGYLGPPTPLWKNSVTWYSAASPSYRLALRRKAEYMQMLGDDWLHYQYAKSLFVITGHFLFPSTYTKRSFSYIFYIFSYAIVLGQCNGEFFLYINMLVLAWASVGLRVSVCLLPAPSHPYTTLHQSAHITCIQNKMYNITWK